MKGAEWVLLPKPSTIWCLFDAEWYTLQSGQIGMHTNTCPVGMTGSPEMLGTLF